jgi:GH24 family phage-related lysozyme (muramidase)
VRTSAAGVRAITREEGCVLHPYNDSAGNATIGVGHLIGHRPVTAADRARYRGFDAADAAALLRSDLERFERAVNAAVKVPVSQGEFDALMSLAFNIGTAGFASSSVVRYLNAGKRRAAADAFLLWRRPPELLPRRKRERAAFLKAGAPTDGLAHLTETERRRCRELDRLRRVDLNQRTREQAERIRVLVRVLTEQRKAIWRAAQEPGGWDTLNRRKRYRSLLARTR